MDNLSQEILEAVTFYKEKEKKVTNAHGWEYVLLEGFNAATKKKEQSLCPVARRWCQPPVELEKAHGLSGVSHSYVLPPGVSADTLELYTEIQRNSAYVFKIPESLCHERLQRVVTALLDKNPSLRQVAFNPQVTEDLMDVIIGVTSAYKAEDIHFYIATRGPDGARIAGEAEACRKEIPAEVDIQWKPSPDTLREIRRQAKTTP